VTERLSDKSSIFTIAINDEGRIYDYPKEVIFSINQNRQKDYLEAANIINTSNAQVVCLQHEFGIYGGWDGIYILSLLSKLAVPLITTLHTVIQNPNANQKRIMSEIIQRSNKIVVMSKKSIELLKDVYAAPAEKIELILHGTPDFLSLDSAHYKKRFKLEGKKMILTFGLLSPNKGIETVIKALPDVIKDFPDITYVVLGKTHPHVQKEHGERYRESLIKLVGKLNLRRYVIFDDRFVKIEELYEWLSASDIYVTPYLNKAQVVSGTLSYAIGAGNAIISTPYWHAEEMLADNRGYLFDFNDSEKLSGILRELLKDEKKLKALQKRTYDFGRQMTWKKVSSKYAELLSRMSNEKKTVFLHYPKSTSTMGLPEFDLSHIKRLTDDTGMIQHAKYLIPDRSTGYCLDDNARAIMLAAWAVFLLKDKEAQRLLPVYCSFVRFMQKEDGSFANFMDYKRNHLEEKGSDDSNGRAIWALGFLIWRNKDEAYRSFALDMIKKAFNIIPKLNLRGKAFSALGLVCYLRTFTSDEQAYELLKMICGDLESAYQKHSASSWKWFEDILCYDNAIMPMALFNAFSVLKDEKLLNTAKESLAFLEKIVFKDDILSIVGNAGWYRKGGEKAQFDQQSVDVAAMVMALQSAYRVTKDTQYLKRMKTAFDWFLGENDLGIPMYDMSSKGCSDGLMQGGASMNQGAESTVSFLLALLAMMEEYEIENLE
jgi:glycosyltransferase involved in cell wall biosynthesis